jgi:hypothetical protein
MEQKVKEFWLVNVNRSDGFSIVGAMVALATLGVVIAIGSATFKNNLQTRKKIVGAASTHDLESSLKTTIADSYKSFLSKACDSGDMGIVSKIAVGTIVELKASNQLTAETNAPSEVSSGISRCSNGDVNKSLGPQDSTFFRCYEVKFGADFAEKAEKGTATATSGSFMEVYGIIKNFQTGDKVLCSSMAADLGNHGAQIFYKIHWVLKNGKDLDYTTKNGVLNVSL